MSKNQHSNKEKSGLATGSNLQLEKVSEMENTRQSKKGKWQLVTEANGDLMEVQSPRGGPLGDGYGNLAPRRTLQPFDEFRQTHMLFRPEPLQAATDAQMMGQTQNLFLNTSKRPLLEQIFDQQQLASSVGPGGELAALSATPVQSPMGVEIQAAHAEFVGRTSSQMMVQARGGQELTHIVIPSGSNATHSRKSSARTREAPEHELDTPPDGVAHDANGHSRTLARILVQDAHQHQAVAHQESNTQDDLDLHPELAVRKLQRLHAPGSGINVASLTASELHLPGAPQYLTQQAIRVAVQKKPQQAVTNVVFSSKELVPLSDAAGQANDGPPPHESSYVRDKDAFLGKKIRQPQSKYQHPEAKQQSQQRYPALQVVSQHIVPTALPSVPLANGQVALPLAPSAANEQHSGAFRQSKRQKATSSQPAKAIKMAGTKQKGAKARAVGELHQRETSLGVTPDLSRSSRRSNPSNNRGISPFNYNTADSSGRNTQTRLVDYPNGKSQLEKIPESERQGQADVIMVSFQHSPNRAKAGGQSLGDGGGVQARSAFAANGRVISGAEASPNRESQFPNHVKKPGAFGGLILQPSPADRLRAQAMVSPTSSQFQTQVTQSANQAQYNLLEQMSVHRIILDDQNPDCQTEIIDNSLGSPRQQSWRNIRQVIHIRPGGLQSLEQSPQSNKQLDNNMQNQYSAQASPIISAHEGQDLQFTQKITQMDLDNQLQEAVKGIETKNQRQASPLPTSQLQQHSVSKPKYCPKTFQIHGSQISMIGNSKLDKIVGKLQKNEEQKQQQQPQQKRDNENQISAQDHNTQVETGENPAELQKGTLNNSSRTLMNAGESSKTYIIMVESGEQGATEGGRQQWPAIPDGYRAVKMDIDQLQNLDQEVKLSDLLEQSKQNGGGASNGGSNQVAIIIGAQGAESGLPELLRRINQGQESQKANKREFSPKRAKKFIKQNKINKFRFDLNAQYQFDSAASAGPGFAAEDQNLASFGTLNPAQSPRDDGEYHGQGAHGQPSLTQYSPLSIVEGPVGSLRETRFRNSPTRTLNKESPLDTHPESDQRRQSLQPTLMELTIANKPKAELAADSAIDTEDAGERSVPEVTPISTRKAQPLQSTASLPAQWRGADSNPSPPFDGHPSHGRGSLSKISPQRTGIAGFGSVLERQAEASRAMNNAGRAPEIAQISSTKICSVSKLTQKPKIPRNLPTPMKASLMKKMELDQQKSQRATNPNGKLQLTVKNHAATGIVCEAESVTSRTVTPNIRDIAILARKKKQTNMQLNIQKGGQVKIVHSTVAKQDDKQAHMSAKLHAQTLNQFHTTGRTSPADAMNLTDMTERYNYETQEPLSATAPIFPANQQTISRFPPLRQRQISPRYRSSAKPATLLERLNQAHKVKDEQTSAVDQEDTQLTLNSQRSNEGGPKIITGDQTKMRVGIEVKKGSESGENKSLMNAVQDQKAANQAKYSKVERSDEYESIKKAEDRQFRKYIYEQFNVTGDFQSSKPKIIYSNISNDPMIKYVRRINNNDYWQGKNAEKLHQTMISQYSQDYQKLCVMHPGPQSSRLQQEDANASSAKEFAEQMEYLKKQSIANRLKTHKYLNISEQLDVDGRTPLPHSFTATQNIEFDSSAIEANLNKTTLNINSETNMPSIFEHRRFSEVANEANKQKRLDIGEDYFPRHKSNARESVNPQFFAAKCGVSPFLQKQGSRNSQLGAPSTVVNSRDSSHKGDHGGLQPVFHQRHFSQVQASGGSHVTVAGPSDSGLSHRDEPQTAHLRMPHETWYTAQQSTETEAYNGTETPMLTSHYAHALDNRVTSWRSGPKKQKRGTHAQHWPSPTDGRPMLELSGNRFAVQDKYQKQMEGLMHATFRNNQENVTRKIRQI